MSLPRTLAPIALLVAGAAWAPPAAASDHLKLTDGTLLVGRATAYDPDARVVTFVTEDGRTLQIAAADLDRLSAYKLAKTRVKEDDAGDQVKLGNFARDVGLYAHSNRHYGTALSLDPSLAAAVEEQRVVLRREAADFCMKNARAELQRGDEREAERWLTTLLQKLPNEPQAAEAEAMLAELYPKNHEPLDDELEQGLGEQLLAGDLKKGKQHYDAMLADIQKGLASSRSTSAAKKSFDAAWTSGQRALDELDRVQKKMEDDPAVAELFDSYRDLVHQHMVDAQIHLASLLTVQTDYQGANEAVGKALSVDPDDREALVARARIEEASSRGWGWR